MTGVEARSPAQVQLVRWPAGPEFRDMQYLDHATLHAYTGETLACLETDSLSAGIPTETGVPRQKKSRILTRVNSNVGCRGNELLINLHWPNGKTRSR